MTEPRGGVLNQPAIGVYYFKYTALMASTVHVRNDNPNMVVGFGAASFKSSALNDNLRLDLQLS